GTVSGNSVTFYGIPIDPPGSTGVRVVRITNVRINAFFASSSSTLPQQIVADLSVSGGKPFNINNPRQTLALIQQALSTSVTKAASYQQCNGVNQGAGTPNFNVQTTEILTVKELFPNSFKTQGPGVSKDGNSAAPSYPQNVPGFVYNSEGGFYDPTLSIGSP